MLFRPARRSRGVGGHGFINCFGKHSQAPYLAQRLRSRGAFLPNYYEIGHMSLDNYIAMVSGQAPNTQTQADCQFYGDFTPGTPTSDGQYRGSGCVYPPGVATVANQLEGSGYSWKGYMEDMNAKAPPATETRCRHPALNSQDDTQQAEVGDQYAARHNPFVYFHSLIDSGACAAGDVPLGQLDTDLGSAATMGTVANVRAGTYFVRVQSLNPCGQSGVSNEAIVSVR